MKLSRVSRNAIWIIGCKVAQSGFALVINMLTARYFGPSNFGILNYAASIVAFFTPIMTLGTSDILVSEIVNQPEKEGELLGTSMMMTFVSSLFCLLGIFSFINIVNKSDGITITVVMLYSLLLVIQSIEQIQYWFHAKYLSKIVSIVSFGAYLLISIYKFLLLALKKNIYWFAISNSIDHLLIALALVVFYKRKAKTKLCCTKQALKQLWKKGKHYIFPEMMGLVLAQSDRIMLQNMCGDAEVGLYSAALSIASLTSFAFSAIIMSFRPQILENKKASETIYKKNMTKLYGIIIYLAVAQSIIISVFASSVVSILYGVQYIEAVPMLRIVVWYTTFSYIGGVRSVWILAENKQQYLWIISLVGMVANVLLNLWLIPMLGGSGAAIATLITQILTNIVIVYLVRPLRDNIRYIIKGLNYKDILQ